MRHLIRKNDLYFGVFYLLFWLVALWGVFVPTSAICENSIADEIVSLNVTNRPLVEVLEDISTAVGCQFSIDESWEDYPITASFANEPLFKGLKRVLRNINNAIIYGADRTVRIIIYDEAAPSGKTIRSPQESIPQIQPYSEATAPQPEVVDPDDSSDAENVDQPPEEAAESASESDATDVETTETQKEESGEADAEEKSDEPEQVTPAPEQESNQTEETESTLDPSEETNQN